MSSTLAILSPSGAKRLFRAVAKPGVDLPVEFRPAGPIIAITGAR